MFLPRKSARSFSTRTASEYPDKEKYSFTLTDTHQIASPAQIDGTAGDGHLFTASATYTLMSFPDLLGTLEHVLVVENDLLAEGFDGYLSKPFSKQQLLQRFADVLQTAL
jgi:CheY-like chemotaxis protein